jgi:hypothetical protein
VAYYLEIYAPDGFGDVTYQRDTPFGAISRGDFVNVPAYGARWVEVMAIEHVLFGEGTEHKTILHTRAYVPPPEAR